MHFPPITTTHRSDGGVLALALEVFHHAESNTFFVQQRSPVLSRTAFAAEVGAWVADAAFGRLLVLTTYDSAYRVDLQMAAESKPIAYVAGGGGSIGDLAAAAGLEVLDVDPDAAGQALTHDADTAVALGIAADPRSVEGGAKQGDEADGAGPSANNGGAAVLHGFTKKIYEYGAAGRLVGWGAKDRETKRAIV